MPLSWPLHINNPLETWGFEYHSKKKKSSDFLKSAKDEEILNTVLLQNKYEISCSLIPC